MVGVPSLLARWVTRGRVAVLLALAIATAALASQLPRLRADPSPRGLVAALEGHEAVEARFEARFGAQVPVIALLVESDTLLSRGALEYVRVLSRRFADAPWVESVQSLATTPLPRRAAAPADGDGDGDDGDLTLDDLDAPTLDDLDALEGDPDAPGGPTLDDLGEGDEDAPDAATLEALGGIVRAEPERFPMGLTSLAALTAEIDASPLLGDAPVTEADVARARDALEQPTLLDGRLVSADRTVTAVALFLDEGLDHRAERDAVRELRAWLAEHPPPTGVSVHLAGLPYLHVSIVEKMVDDQVRLIPLAALICLVVLFLSFRWWAAVAMSLAAVVATALWVLGGMAIVGEKITLLNNILPALLLIIGISYSIHLLQRYREEARRGVERTAAVRRTVEAMTVGIFLTAATTAAGLGSLAVARSAMIRNMGLVAALGVFAAFLITMLLLPSLLVGLRSPWEAERPPQAGGHEPRGALESIAVALFRAAARRRWLVVGLAAVLLAGSVAAATRLRADSAVLDQFDPTEPAYRATRLQETKLGGVRPLEVVVALPAGRPAGAPEGFLDPRLLAGLDAVARWAEDQPEVIWAASVSDYLHGAWALLTGDPATRDAPFVDRDQVAGLAHLLSRQAGGPVARYVAEEGTVARLELRLRDVGARASLDFIERLEERVRATVGEAAGAPVAVEMTGEAYVGSFVVATVVGDMVSSLATAVPIIFTLVILLLRSLRLGLLSIPPNILPLTLAMAWMIFRDIPLNAATAITFSVSLGMAVDGSIHLLARFREEQRRVGAVEDALVRSAQGTGRAIVVSNLTLMAGFAVLTFSGFVPIRRFGELIAVTIAATTFTTLVLLPALLRLAYGRTAPPAAPRPG